MRSVTMDGNRTPIASPAQRRRTSWKHLGSGLCVLGAMVTLFWLVLSQLLQVRDLPAVAPEPPAAKALSSHVLLFIWDGLRHDLAVDPKRMPNFARHMREDTHGVLWAGRVTMTSAAVMSMGAGQHSDFAQLITNLNVRRANYNDIFANARTAGYRTGLIGDVTWADMFGKFDEQTVDPNGMSIERDDSALMLEALDKMAFGPKPPNLVVAHFIAPDHMAHAYQATSPQYYEIVSRLDGQMQQFLDRLPPDWTVFLMSDHGQTDTGAHGTDTPTMRKSPLCAYGPGIRKGKDLGNLDQIDFGPTLAALMGMSGPTFGRGFPMLELLDMPSQEAAKVACAEAHRVQRLAKADGASEQVLVLEKMSQSCNNPAAPVETQIQQSKASVASFDQYKEQAKLSSNSAGLLGVFGCLVVVLGVTSIVLARTRSALSGAKAYLWGLLALGLAGLCVVLTLYVERITPPYHNVTRVILFVLIDGLALYSALRPSHAARFCEKRPWLVLGLLPGALACSYSANTPSESLVGLLLVGLTWAFAAHPYRQNVSWLGKGKASLSGWRLLAWLVSLIGLLSFGIYQEDSLPRALTSRPWLLLTTGCVAIGLWLLAGAKQRDSKAPKWHVAAAIAIAVGAVLLRRVIPSNLGWAATLLFPVLAIAAGYKGRWTLAFGLGFGAYAWVSRDVELIPVASGALYLEALGHAVRGTSTAEDGRPHVHPWTIVTVTLASFAVAFLARVGLQGGLDLTNIDYGAGGFGDPSVSEARLMGCAIWKYAAATMLLLAVLLRPMNLKFRRTLSFAFMVTFALRAATLAWMLFACRSSYWSALRTLSDLPSALITGATGAIVLWVVNLVPVRERGVERESEPEERSYGGVLTPEPAGASSVIRLEEG